MSWLNSVRNVIPFVVKKETPDNLWHKCKGCGQMVFTKELEDNLNVCPKCDHHDRIGPKVRFRHLLDEGSCNELPAPKVPEDPLLDASQSAPPQLLLPNTEGERVAVAPPEVSPVVGEASPVMGELV